MIQINVDCSEERKQFLDGKDIQDKIKSKAIQLCQAFVGGQWDHADQSDLGLPGPKRADPGHITFLINISHCHSAYQILEI